MENNRSFSLHFNPLTNVKCVKDYEEEIAQLKTENFELKAQLTQSNIPKVLYENKQEMEVLLSQKQELQNSFNNLSRAYEGLVQEKRLIENKYGQELASCNEKNSLLEDENKRLMLRLEKLNREIQDTAALKNELENLQMTVQNLDKQQEQSEYDYKQQFKNAMEEYKEFQENAEYELKGKVFEIEGLKRRLEAAAQKEKNDSFVISDLKATLTAQMRDRSLVDEMRASEVALRAQIEEIQRERQDCEFKLKSSQEIIERVHKEHRVYLNGMDRFKLLIFQKLGGVSSSLVDLNEKFLQIKAFCYISDENRGLLSKLKVKYSNLNEILDFFKEKHAEVYRKMDAIRKEAASAALGDKKGISKQTQALLQEFRNQFGEAKNELLICKKYLDKKATENKILKNENAKLVSELQKRNRSYENGLARTNVMRI